MKIPKWLILQGKIDYYYFVLGQMLEHEKRMIPIEKMIDQATGYDKKKLKEAKKIMKKIDKLKEEYFQIVK